MCDVGLQQIIILISAESLQIKATDVYIGKLRMFGVLDVNPLSHLSVDFFKVVAK